MSTTEAKQKIFIGGEWAGSASGETMEVINPATEDVIAEVPRCGAEDVDRAVAAAKAAYPGWFDATPGERAEVLLKLADVLEDNADELAEIESRNVGKPLSYAKDELPVCVDNVRFMAGAARHPRRSRRRLLRGYLSIIVREPLGVIGVVTPWNYPLLMAAWKIAPILAAGNVLVLKPSEQTPLTTLKIAELVPTSSRRGAERRHRRRVPVGEAIGSPTCASYRSPAR